MSRPGTVACRAASCTPEVGDDLSIHVRNGDSECHSFHLHGLHYGIDSDGAWPLGVQAHDGRRSDQILPGDPATIAPVATRTRQHAGASGATSVSRRNRARWLSRPSG